VCHARVATAWCHTHLVLLHSTPSFPGTLVGSRFSPSSPYWTPLFSFLVGTVACTPPCRANPVPSFLLFPNQARTGSAQWPMLSPSCDPLVIPLHAASTTGALCHHHHLPSYKMPPCLPLLHSTPKVKVELAESIPPLVLRWEKLGKQSRRSSWGQSYEIWPLLSNLGSPVRSDGVT
jgi:hypothetical protein